MIDKILMANRNINMKKNKSKSKFKILFARIFNIRAWMDWDRVKAGGEFIETGTKKIFTPSPEHPKETFEEAQQRLKLTNEQVVARGRSLYRLSMMMACLSFALFIYIFYHIIYGTIHAALLTFALSSLSAAISFRYHFWYFQIKSRKLGCTFNEWYRQGLMGDKS